MTDPDRLHFIRCTGCLSVMAIPGGRPPARARCGACNSPIESMGPVRLDRARMGSLTTCDARCTMASGPSCNCQCQGKNHGSGIRVGIATQSGGLIRVTPPNPERAQRIAGEWREALHETKGRIARNYPMHDPWTKGEEMNPFAAGQARKAQAYLDKVNRAETMRTHAGRLEALAKVNAALKGESR